MSTALDLPLRRCFFFFFSLYLFSSLQTIINNMISSWSSNHIWYTYFSIVWMFYTANGKLSAINYHILTIVNILCLKSAMYGKSYTKHIHKHRNLQSEIIFENLNRALILTRTSGGKIA